MLDLNKIEVPDNVQIVDRVTGKTKVGKLNLPDDIYEELADAIFINLVEYNRRNGDMQKLSIRKVFQRVRTDEKNRGQHIASLSCFLLGFVWTFKFVCGMCLFEN